MRGLRDCMQNQMTVELEAVKAARAQALADITNEVQVRLCKGTNNVSLAHIPQTTIATSLKRKRDDEYRGDDATTMCVRGDGEAESVGCPVQTTTLAAIPDAITAPPAKRARRARRIISAVAQTATAVTIGAIVTWSALAFS